jgi:hypothetical protein
LVHLPPVPVRLHATHGPEQAVLQQTPSAQKPVSHAQPSAHEAPAVRSTTHLLPEQKALVLQFVEQVLGQLVKQAPAPLQVYVPHSVSGSVPAVKLVQVPRAPATSQARQPPVHAVSQQRPSTQKPDVHSTALRQAEPFTSLSTHRPSTVLHHWVELHALTSGGQAADVPEQLSATVSQVPPAARQTVPAAANRSVPQVADVPEQFSAASQVPVAGRQTVLAVA